MSEPGLNGLNRAEHEVLFAALALQADLLSPRQFAEVCNEWTRSRPQSLADLLVKSGRLTSEGRQEVEGLLRRKLRKHGGSARAGLAEVAGPDLHQALAAVRDPELREVLAGPASLDGHLTTTRNAFALGSSGALLSEPDRFDSEDVWNPQASPPWTWRTRQWFRRHFRLVNSAAAILAAAVIGTAVLVSLAGDNADSGPARHQEEQFTTPPMMNGFFRFGEAHLGKAPPELTPAQLLAKPYVDGLFTTLVRKAEVIESLRQDKALGKAYREAALYVAENYSQSALALNNMSWYVVRLPNMSKAAFEHALIMAEEACRLSPSGYNLNTLGVAQYRLGRYEEALKTLEGCEPMNRDPERGSIPADLAFIAMIHHRLGMHEEARAELKQLRQKVKIGNWRDQLECEGFLLEAEKLINGEPAK